MILILIGAFLQDFNVLRFKICIATITIDNKGQSRELHVAWIDLLRQIEKGSTLENEVSNCLMHWYGRQHTWTEYAKNGIMPINIAAHYGYLKIVKTIHPIKKIPMHLCPLDGLQFIRQLDMDTRKLSNFWQIKLKKEFFLNLILFWRKKL